MIRKIFDVLFYVMVFLLAQLLMTVVVVGVQYYAAGVSLQTVGDLAMKGQLLPDVNGLILISVTSSLLTLALFCVFHWVHVSRSYLRSHPWLTLCWVAVLALGTVIPSELLAERLPYDMPTDMKAMLGSMMGNRWGYLAIGLLAPLAEEVVFRGAVLRILLQVFSRQWHWVPIALSALCFGAVHGNVPQFVHATLIGLLLGWMYYRTNSIVPGVVFHWMNNTVAYVVYNLMPGTQDADLIDIFSGQQRAVYGAVFFSLCIMLPAIYQLHLHMRRAAD